MPAGVQAWVNNVLHTDTSTVTSRALGMRVASAGHFEAITVDLQPGKTLWWHIVINGNLNAYCYRQTFVNSSLNQGPNQFTIQVDPPSWNQSQTGTAYITWGEHSVGSSGGGGGSSPDYTPDAISLTNVNIDTPNETGVGVPRKFQVTGINQPIQLKVARSNSTQTGNLTVNRTLVRSSDSQNGPWTTHATFVGNGEVEFMVSNGKWVEISFEKTTSSGRATSSYNVAVTNSTLSQSMASFSVSAKVDNDDNFGVSDPNLDAIDWANISQSSTHHEVSPSNAYRKLTGINQKIVLRATISNVSGTFASGTRLEMYVNGTLRYHSTNVANGSWAGGDFNPNEDVAFVAVLKGVSGEQRNVSYTVTVKNITTDTVVDTFTVNLTAGVPDYTPDAFAFGSAQETTNNPTGTVGVPSRQITGINRTVRLRAERFNYSGNLTTAITYVYRGPSSTGPWTKMGEINSTGTATRFIDFDVKNGEWIYYYAYGDTSSGKRSASWDIAFWNESTSHSHITSGKLTLTVDNDGNHNDATPNAMTWPNISWSTNEHFLFGAYNSNGPVVSGITVPIRLRFQFTAASSTTTWQNLEIVNHQHVTHAVIENFANGSWVDVTVANGDTFIVKCSGGSDSGRRTASGTVRVTNESDGGAVLGTFTVGITVDADDNYNKNTGVAKVDWPNMFHSYSSTNGSSSTPNYTSGPARTISGLAAGQTATLTLSGSASGDAFAAVDVFKNGVYQGMKLYSPEDSSSVQNNYTGVTVQNGDSIYFRCAVGGRNAYNWEGGVSKNKNLNVTVNASLGGVVDTFSFDGSYTDWYNSGGGGGGGQIEL